MTRPQDFLHDAWAHSRHQAGWLSTLSESLGLDSEDEDYLCRLDETLLALRPLEWRSRADVRQAVHEFQEEVFKSDPEWARARRTDYLRNELERLEARIAGIRAEYRRHQLADAPLLERLIIVEAAGLSGLERRKASLGKELEILGRRATREGLIPHEIERARTFPIDALMDSNKGFALCPLHDDTKPSMWLKGGFGYCFSCGGHLDSIGYLMRVRGLGFREAVQMLQGSPSGAPQ